MLEEVKDELEKALKEGMKGPDKECSYYPCHFHGQDCTFCYCPFYPCMDESLGGMKLAKSGKRVWSCIECDWIHRGEVVERVLEELGNCDASKLERESLLKVFRRVRYG